MTTRIELLTVPDCPLADRVRTLLRRSLATAGVAAEVIERVGAYPSPTLLIDGVDVVTGAPVTGNPCCRVDLPTTEQILTALGWPNHPGEHRLR